MAALTGDQIAVLNIIQQVGSSLSLVGCIFIIGTFCFCDAFHKSINRLVFYASFGNLASSVAFMMAGLHIDQPLSAACQAQAFLLDVFVAADAFWTLAMAVNVYLTFYFRFDAHALRRIEVPYLFLCYGIPFVPGFIFLFIKNSEGQHVYGAAGMWCWITPQWDPLRIATFYGPVWVVIAITMAIYLRSGTTIYRKHQQLRKFQGSTSGGMSSSTRGNTVTNMRTTEVVVTSEVVTKSETMELHTIGGQSTAHATTATPNGIEAGTSQPQTSTQTGTNATSVTAGGAPRPSNRIHQEINNAAWQYTKCALLFFVVILITWLPSSANRVYSHIHPRETSVTLQFMSATVLPLQGFWNAVIYAVTSWAACRKLLDKWRNTILKKRNSTAAVGGSEGQRLGGRASIRGRGRMSRAPNGGGVGVWEQCSAPAKRRTRRV
ncbi:hypothetical protein ACCO45_000519 [Purpureocillium lilacinum]|uniref:Uncharacterized protein n=1 Tax=Purpureocillium lilacinum TaxID=33203 RepID=A0ACC4E774_PURLI